MTLNFVCQEFEKAAKNVIRSKIPPTRILEIVFLFDTNVKENSDPLLDFWKPKESQYPRLAILARKYLRSIPSERVSSKMGNSVSKKRNTLGYPERCHNHYFNLNCIRLHYFVLLFLRLSSIQKNYWGSLLLETKLRSSSIFKNKFCLPFSKKLGRIPFLKKWGRLPFAKIFGRLPFFN